MKCFSQRPEQETSSKQLYYNKHTHTLKKKVNNQVNYILLFLVFSDWECNLFYKNL